VFVKRLALEGQAGFWLTAGGWFPTLVQISATTMAEAALHLKEQLNIWVSDLFALHKELQSKGAKVIRAPEETFYHTREIELEDCNGYVLCSGQNIED